MNFGLEHQRSNPVNISNTFSQRKFTAVLRQLKPAKTLGSNSIPCSELMIQAGAILKSRLRDFLSSCLRQLKIPTIRRRALVVAIPKPKNSVGGPKSYRQYLSSVSPTRSSKSLSTSVLSQLLIHCSLKSRLGFDVESQPWIKLFC